MILQYPKYVDMIFNGLQIMKYRKGIFKYPLRIFKYPSSICKNRQQYVSMCSISSPSTLKVNVPFSYTSVIVCGPSSKLNNSQPFRKAPLAKFPSMIATAAQQNQHPISIEPAHARPP